MPEDMEIGKIKESFKGNINDTLKKFLQNKEQEYKFKKIYTGKVEDNVDPEKKGRCRIRVFGLLGPEIPVLDLPFAIPDFSFVGSTIGSFVVPPIGAIVRVEFDNGDIYRPRYSTKVFDSNNISSEADEDYPDSMIFFETDAGDFFKINRSTNITIYHAATGAQITIDEAGSIEIDTENTTTGNIDLKVKGNLTYTNESSGGGDININNIKGDITINNDEGDMIIKNKKGTVDIKSKKTNVTASGEIDIKGVAGTRINMSSGGVKINNNLVVNKKFIDWLIKFSTAFGIGNLGAPVPINPLALTELNSIGLTGPASHLTNDNTGI